MANNNTGKPGGSVRTPADAPRCWRCRRRASVFWKGKAYCVTCAHDEMGIKAINPAPKPAPRGKGKKS